MFMKSSCSAEEKAFKAFKKSLVPFFIEGFTELTFKICSRPTDDNLMKLFSACCFTLS